jgi:DNA excision repair protein ERCC-4
MKLPSEIPLQSVLALIDTREQTPLDLSPLSSVTATLATGDYSIRGLEHIVAVERKSLPDLLACVGRERERFDREVHRLLSYPVRALVVESTWQEIETGEWRSDVRPQAVLGSLLGWIAAGLPVLMAANHEQAGRYVARLLVIVARRRWHELRALAGAAGLHVTEAE